MASLGLNSTDYRKALGYRRLVWTDEGVRGAVLARFVSRVGGEAALFWPTAGGLDRTRDVEVPSPVFLIQPTSPSQWATDRIFGFEGDVRVSVMGRFYDRFRDR